MQDNCSGKGIYILYGASGCGKTTIVDILSNNNADSAFKKWVSIHSKGTTRHQRFYDGIELVCGLSEKDIKEDYIGETEITANENFSYGEKGYVYYQYKTALGKIAYGIQKKQINEALNQGKRHLIICNNLDVIKQIKEDYSTSCAVKVLFLKFTAPLPLIKEFITERRQNGKYKNGATDEEDLSLRIKKISELDNVFNENSDFFDGVILNKFKERQEIDFALEFLKEQLYFFMRVPKITRETKDAFIITSFADKDSLRKAQYAYREGCKRIINKDGESMRAFRVDQLYSNGSTAIVDNIYSAINNAEVVIADLTDNRPNCYYELGYARALNKPVILFSDSSTTLEFDERGYECIQYDVYEPDEIDDLITRVTMALQKIGYKSKIN
ncbi:MAG: nucleoside 2-deoxyribosyltransferase [Clostridiales bacterium]|nr:nucleoside 2-deoxyribosyltransferase [Clostridiales bacterium]